MTIFINQTMPLATQPALPDTFPRISNNALPDSLSGSLPDSLADISHNALGSQILGQRIGHLPLPHEKKLALHNALSIILGAILGATQPHKANQSMMVLLFGGHARGDYLKEKLKEKLKESISKGIKEGIKEGLEEEWGESTSNQSPFDLLVLVRSKAMVKKLERKKRLYHRLQCEVETPISLLIEDIYSMNARLAKGHYFFTGLVQEAAVLYDSGAFRLSTQSASNTQTLLERKRLAQRDFAHWFKKANTYKEYADIAMAKGDINEATFFLHQSVERFYNTMLLTFARYNPNTHNLYTLSALVASFAPPFVRVFPKGLHASHAFDLLCNAYVNARYQPGFRITTEEFEWLSGRVDYLQKLTKEHCQARIISYV